MRPGERFQDRLPIQKISEHPMDKNYRWALTTVVIEDFFRSDSYSGLVAGHFRKHGKVLRTERDYTTSALRIQIAG